MRLYLLLAFIVASFSQLADGESTLLKPARVWTGNSNDPVHNDWVVLVDGEKIAAVGAASEIKALCAKSDVSNAKITKVGICFKFSLWPSRPSV